ncbi:hypothetical protein Goklo_010247, partial [Gossypium klotzschianum]|nr:hypothetical protein [Gossypium klotzschianum]
FYQFNQFTIHYSWLKKEFSYREEKRYCVLDTLVEPIYRRSQMAILYALVARGSVVLAEFTAASTNASAIARQILEKTSGDNDINVSYSQDRYIFHVKRTDGLTVLCMADESAGRRIPFAFLEDMHQRFVRTYGGAVLSALPYGMNDEFSRVLSQQMEYYSNDPNADRINRLKGEMSQVRNVMIENIDKVLERGDRLELLVDKTANMQGNTFRFRKQARRFKNTVWWRNVRLTYAFRTLTLLCVFTCLALSMEVLICCLKYIIEGRIDESITYYSVALNIAELRS